MNINDISDSIDNLKLDKKTRDAIIKLIDAKINNDMNTFTEELKQTKETLQNQNTQTKETLQNQIVQLRSEISIVKWLQGVIVAILLAMFAKSIF